jgi:hypothetical protein
MAPRKKAAAPLTPLVFGNDQIGDLTAFEEHLLAKLRLVKDVRVSRWLVHLLIRAFGEPPACQGGGVLGSGVPRGAPQHAPQRGSHGCGSLLRERPPA